MKPFARFVRLFERRPPKPALTLVRRSPPDGTTWHEEPDQSRMCVACTRVMLPDVRALIAGKWCGECFVALHPDATEVPPAA